MIAQEATSPKVSMLIPVYNRENFIGECIESALNQSFTDIEVVVVDNSSTDATWQVCLEYAGRDSRVRAFRNERNVGPVLNWKRCIDEARGKYGKILFSDDLIAPRFLEATLPLFSDDVAFVYTSVTTGKESTDLRITCEQGQTEIVPASEFIRASLSDGDAPLSPGCAIFRTCDLKSNLTLTIPSPTIQDFLHHGAGPDVLLFLLSAKNYRSVAFVHEPLSFFRQHTGSISIADRGNYLLRCYTQAKMWFAESYYRDEVLKEYYSYTWYNHCKVFRYWERPSLFLSRYSYNTSISLLYPILKFLAKKIWGKFPVSQ